MTDKLQPFNLVVVHKHFSQSLLDEEDVVLKDYLDSYGELTKFFNLMGSIFSFVDRDLKSKIDILKDLLKQNDASFQTVKQMIQYEKDNKLLNKSNYTSGSRTLLRLHRGLDFIRSFLESIGKLKDEDITAAACRQAYDVTLAKFHPFLIRKGAQLAMLAMPTRQELLRKVCFNDEQHIQTTINVLPDTLEITAIVYARIEKLYTVHELHNLP